MRKLLQTILATLAKRIISRYRPIVIGVTGSVGKSSTKEAIFAVLSKKYSVLRNTGNFNQEIGVPLALLGVEPFYKTGKTLWNKFVFVGKLLNRFWLAYGLKGNYPKYVVLEMAADRPGDIDYLVKIAKPSIGVITAVGNIPVHVEFYASPEEVALEKSILVRNLPQGGLAVLNCDDQAVLNMKNDLRAKIVTFGFSDKADVRASGISYFVDENSKKIGGLSFKIYKGNSFIPIKLKGIIGIHQIYAILASTAVGINLGLNLVDISESLESIELLECRMTLRKGIMNSTIIDDSYNASPIAVQAALDTLKKFGDSAIELNEGKGRKIAILGDMKELGRYEIEAHQSIGNLAGQVVDVLVTVGAAAKFIADSAGNKMLKENIFSFSTSEEAKSKVRELIREGDIILIKGSRSMKMEEIAKEITAAFV